MGVHGSVDRYTNLKPCTDFLSKDIRKLFCNNSMCHFICIPFVLQVYGVRHPLNDPEFTKLHEMNGMIKEVLHQVKNDPIMDFYPALFDLRKVFFWKTDTLLKTAHQELSKRILPKIAEAKVKKRLCLSLLWQYSTYSIGATYWIDMWSCPIYVVGQTTTKGNH